MHTGTTAVGMIVVERKARLKPTISMRGAAKTAPRKGGSSAKMSRHRRWCDVPLDPPGTLTSTACASLLHRDTRSSDKTLPPRSGFEPPATAESAPLRLWPVGTSQALRPQPPDSWDRLETTCTHCQFFLRRASLIAISNSSQLVEYRKSCFVGLASLHLSTPS